MSQRTERTKIAWTDFTFNPWVGCTKVSAGCTNCYAEREDKYRKWTPEGWGKGQPRKRTSVANWRKPLIWNAEAQRQGRRFKVFTASLADIFDDEVDPDWRRDLFDLIYETKSLDWLVLTKRPENFRRMLMPSHLAQAWSNVWLGVTAEDQKAADERIPILLDIPAIKRWVSAEPLIGPINFKPEWLRAWNGGVDWIIVGGESGSRARPMEDQWARDIRDRCYLYNVAFFMKQMDQSYGPDFKTLEAFPKDLQIQEFPA